MTIQQDAPQNLSNAEQIRWQRQAATFLGKLLELAAKEGLPAITWTVQSAGASLVGQVLTHPEADRREVFGTWRTAIAAAAGRGPDIDREAGTPGSQTRLVARWDWLPLTPGRRHPAVHVALTATIWPDDGETYPGGIGDPDNIGIRASEG